MRHPKPTDNVLLDARQTATLLGICPRTVWKMAAAKQLPPPVYVTPRAPRWVRAELDAAIDRMQSARNQ
jgi:predicted DNA-binding transcriptional regulator AlpA